MAKTCPKCRQENRTDAQACIACGWELAPPDPAAAAGLVTPPPAGAVRAETAAAESENPLWAGRACYLAVLHQWLMYLAACLAVAVLYAYVRAQAGPENIWSTMTAMLVVIVVVPPGLWLAVKTLYRRWSVGYRLTEQRLFIDRGLIGRVTDQTELFRVDDVQVRQGPIQRLLGLGDVVILSKDVTDHQLVIGGIKNPAAVAEHIRTQMRTLRKQRTLYVDTV